MAMTAQQIEAELADLEEVIAHVRYPPTHQIEVLQLRRAQQRRELLRAALRNLVEAPKGD